jgi:hypothetical protein
MKHFTLLFGMLTIVVGFAHNGHSQEFLTNGLVAYYPFNGNANDDSGNANNGLVSNATPDSDRFGLANAAFSFNAANSQVLVSDNLALRSLVSNYTFNVWASFASIPTHDMGMLFKSSGTGSRVKWTFWQHVQAAPLGVGVDLYKNPDGLLEWAYAYSVRPHRWQMLTFSSSGTNCFIAIDGVVVSVQAGNLALPDTAGWLLSIGGAEPGGSQWFNGKLDDIRIYNRALSAEEVAQLYDLEAPPRMDLIKAVKPYFSHIRTGTNYQLQVSADMINWTNQGFPFTATNPSMVYPQFWDVDNWNQLYFRLQVVP